MLTDRHPVHMGEMTKFPAILYYYDLFPDFKMPNFRENIMPLICITTVALLLTGKYTLFHIIMLLPYWPTLPFILIWTVGHFGKTLTLRKQL